MEEEIETEIVKGNVTEKIKRIQEAKTERDILKMQYSVD